MASKVIEWDGSHIPDELKNFPPGRYAIEPVDYLRPLTEEEETGILAGLDELNAGRGISLVDVVRELKTCSSKS